MNDLSCVFIYSALREVTLIKAGAIAVFAVTATLGCHRKDTTRLTPQQAEHAIAELRNAYDAFNRGDIDAAVRVLNPDVEWIEPVEFPGGGAYHGIDGAKRYLAQSRASAAQVISEPERFITSGNKIIVFVHARVLPKDAGAWRDVTLADVYTFQNGSVSQMRAFTDRQEALHWAGIERLPE